ncbi:uncharacterized protein [Antedon mediterranea]|uniref:uncharacterized protein n=1 Tax=Antedon mediterranea TaxID=105859 RepID=UPI003AF98A77
MKQERKMNVSRLILFLIQLTLIIISPVVSQGCSSNETSTVSINIECSFSVCCNFANGSYCCEDTDNNDVNDNNDVDDNVKILVDLYNQNENSTKKILSNVKNAVEDEIRSRIIKRIAIIIVSVVSALFGIAIIFCIVWKLKKPRQTSPAPELQVESG